jgi:hypothetical protein
LEGRGVNAIEWVDSAIALEEENRELRRLMTALVLAIARNRELVEYARGELERVPGETS